MNKEEVIQRLRDSREATLSVLESLEDEEFDTRLPDSEWTVKDLLFHITMWEAELIKLLWQLQAGQKPTTVHFSGRSDDDINQEWLQLGKPRDLDPVYDDFEGARQQTIRRLQQFSDADLQRELSFPNGKQTLVDRIAADSYGHEEVHLKQLKELYQLD